MRPSREAVRSLSVAAVWLTLTAAAAADEDFADRLRRPTSVSPTAKPLFALLDDIADAQQVTIQLDPRVDRRAVVTPPDGPRPLIRLLDALAEQADADARVLGRSVLVTPRSDADRVATLASLREAELRDRPGRGMPLLAAYDLSPDPPEATPAELLTAVLERFGLTLEGPPPEEALPYDLWRADLRGVSAAEALAFVLVPNGRAFEWTDGGVRVFELPERITLESRVDVPGDGRATPGVVAKANEAAPGAEVEPRGRWLRVVGTRAEADAVREALRPAAEATGGEQRFTLTVDRRPASAVVAALAKQGVPIRVAGSPAEATVSLNLSNATLAELAEAIAAQWPGVTATVADGAAVLAPKPAGK